MKKIISYSFVLIAIVGFLSSCKNDDALFVVTKGNVPQVISASIDTVVLTTAKDQDTVLNFSWIAANFGGAGVAVTYTLEIDKTSDTATWANAKSLAVGTNVLQYTFTGLVLNNLMNEMGVAANTPDTIAIRVRSDVNQYNGSASSVQPIYSTVTLIYITPYAANLYIPGAYQGWDPATAPLLNPVPGLAGQYEAYENITGSGVQYFKYTSAPDFNHINYGDGGSGTLTTNGAAAGLSVPGPAYYELTANLNNNTWTATATTWSIIGDATPGGWNTDTQMSYDPVNQVWTVTANMLAAGSYKFRANDAWSIDFGVDGSGNLQYADNPLYVYNPNLNNLNVAADGNYTITLDLHISGKHTYTAVKN